MGYFRKAGGERHWFVVIQEFRADTKKLNFVCRSPDLVEKLPCWLDTRPEEVHILLHLLYMFRFVEIVELHRVV